MDELIKILEKIKPGVDFTKVENMIEEEILDSFDIVNLVAEIDDKFDVEITPANLIPENFATPNTIYDLIKRLEEEQKEKNLRGNKHANKFIKIYFIFNINSNII